MFQTGRVKPMPFQKGNTGFPANQHRAKLFTDALRMEIAAAGDNHQALRRVARALLTEALKGNIAAIAMIADRLDGKVPQPVGGSEDLGPQRLHISWGETTPPMAADQRDVTVTTVEAVGDLTMPCPCSAAPPPTIRD
jgi:hypothetical protein